MIRAEAVALALSLVEDSDLVIAADGAISREAYRAQDRMRTFYMLGSMGQVASISLGLAMARSERVIGLDGDGNLLMGLGGLAQVGALRPPCLYHLVLDNGCYATTGGQPSLSRELDLPQLANSAGYAWSRGSKHPHEYGGLIGEWLGAPGSAFLSLAVEAHDPNPAPRIPMTPQEMARRFRNATASGI